jgi:hypothetical protein
LPRTPRTPLSPVAQEIPPEISMNHSWFGNVTLSGSNSFIIKPISGE